MSVADQSIRISISAVVGDARTDLVFSEAISRFLSSVKYFECGFGFGVVVVSAVLCRCQPAGWTEATAEIAINGAGNLFITASTVRDPAGVGFSNRPPQYRPQPLPHHREALPNTRLIQSIAHRSLTTALTQCDQVCHPASDHAKGRITPVWGEGPPRSTGAQEASNKASWFSL